MGCRGWCSDRADRVAILPEAFAALRELVRQEPPPRHGHVVSRWRLADIAAALPALQAYSRSGLSRVVRRSGLRLKRGRLRLHSPDAEYAAKVAQIDRVRTLAERYPARITVLYADEAGIYRQPELAPRWYPRGEEPTCTRSHRRNTVHRLCGGLNAITGQVTAITGSRMTVSKLKTFLRTLRKTYPDRWLFVVWDNWPVHKHENVLAEAAKQHIHLLWLPTYAPWLNPIEKLWRWLKQEVVYTHRLADDWDGLKSAVAAFMKRFDGPSPDLVRYTGMCAH